MSAEPRIIRTQAEQALIDAAKAAGEGARGALGARRAAAIDEFTRTGLPHRRMETWKYTDLRALMRSAAPIATESDDGRAAMALADDPLAGLDRARLAMVDGVFRPDLSDMVGLGDVSVLSTQEALANDDGRIGAYAEDGLDPTVALNTALANGGIILDVPAGRHITRAVELVHVMTAPQPQASFVRNVVMVGDGAKLRFIETHLSAAGVAHQANVVTEFGIGAKAEVKAARLQATGDASIHVATLVARVGAGAEFDHTTLTTGAAVSRAQTFLRIIGEQARVGLCGATLVGGKRHSDTLLRITHEVPGSTSRVLYKNAVGGEGTGAFQGLIIVDAAAQKTDGRMMTRTLLLSEDASFAQKPELEIYADDVQCGHGATSGRIDEEMLFYFLSRGIPRAEAERLLLIAFLSEGLEALGDADIAAALEPVVESWLAGR